LNSAPPPAPESTTRVAVPAQLHPPAVTGSLQAHSPIMRGRATWYEHPGQTASGERFDPNRFTAAHRTLPFGTRLRVVNLHNRRSVNVRINDRIPPKPKVVIDLSRASARAIGITARQGVGLVALYRMHAASVASAHQPIRPKRPPAPATVIKRDHVVETTGSIPVRPRLRPPRLVSTPAARFVLPEALRPTGL
jgi:rare lipoprotein A